MAFDFAEILDATKTVEVTYLDKIIVCSVYENANERMDVQSAINLRSIADEAGPISREIQEVGAEIELAEKTSPDRVPVLNERGDQLIPQARLLFVKMYRAMIPLVVASWTVDGEPLVYQGKECPPSESDRLPDVLILRIGEAVEKSWGDNSEKKVSVDTSPPESDTAALSISA